MQKSNEAFMCKITMSLMKDPVMDPDGFSYEREAIEKWIKEHGTSPMTRRPLRLDELKPNRALKDAIEEEYSKRKEAKVDDDEPPALPKNEFGDVKIRMEKSEGSLAISFEPSDLSIPIPSDIVVVVDTSGSMQSDATVQNDKGKKESNGLSVLDIVKHAAKTIVRSKTFLGIRHPLQTYMYIRRYTP